MSVLSEAVEDLRKLFFDKLKQEDKSSKKHILLLYLRYKKQICINHYLTSHNLGSFPTFKEKIIFDSLSFLKRIHEALGIKQKIRHFL